MQIQFRLLAMTRQFAMILISLLIITDVAISGSQSLGRDENLGHPYDKGRTVSAKFDGTSSVTDEEIDLSSTAANVAASMLSDYDYEVPAKYAEEIKNSEYSDKFDKELDLPEERKDIPTEHYGTSSRSILGETKMPILTSSPTDSPTVKTGKTRSTNPASMSSTQAKKPSDVIGDRLLEYKSRSNHIIEGERTIATRDIASTEASGAKGATTSQPTSVRNGWSSDVSATKMPEKTDMEGGRLKDISTPQEPRYAGSERKGTTDQPVTKTPQESTFARASDHDATKEITRTSTLQPTDSFGKSTSEASATSLTSTTIQTDTEDLQTNSEVPLMTTEPTDKETKKSFTTLGNEENSSPRYSFYKDTPPSTDGGSTIVIGSSPQPLTSELLLRNNSTTSTEEVSGLPTDHYQSSIQEESTTMMPENTIGSTETALPRLQATTGRIDIVSPRRVERSEADVGAIHWKCPPDPSSRVPLRTSRFQWHKLSGKRTTLVLRHVNSLTNDMDIQDPGFEDEGRYACLPRETSPFVPSEIYFYQFIILKTKWVDIGFSSVTSSYYNQMMVLNCPHGDIIINETPLKDKCSSRITMVERYPERTQDLYKCSDTTKFTEKLPATFSSQNCSLSLMGCNSSEEITPVINTDRCTANPNETFNQQSSTRCPGKVLIRFYYDLSDQRCLPFETDICGYHYSSFATLDECEKNCLVVSKAIRSCFLPENTNQDQLCNEGSGDGYMTTYNILTNECHWFLNRPGCQVSKNVFRSILECRRTCANKHQMIQMELRKVCIYKGFQAESPLDNLERWVYLYHENDCVQRNVSLSEEPFQMSFTTKMGCQMCKTVSSAAICGSRPENGRCRKQEIKWHFASQIGRCIPILDGGCGKSLNRFDTKIDCEKICIKFLTSSDPVTTATRITMTTTANPTYTETITKTYTSAVTKKKRVHRGIGNNYTMSLMIPKDYNATPLILNVQERLLERDPCFGEVSYGTCKRGPKSLNYTVTKSTFASNSGQCLQVQFTGCNGGENLFDNANDCQSSCKSRLRYLKHKKCQSPYSTGCVTPGNAHRLIRYHFVASEMKCVAFDAVDSKTCLNLYSKSLNHCNEFCVPKKPTEYLLRNKCFGKVVVDERSCREDQRTPLWFYMVSIRQCLQYSTCPVALGGNVFLTKSDCEVNCLATNMTTICRLPKDEGIGNLPSYPFFYDDQEGRCHQFNYKGSMGNWNRFLSKEECINACGKDMSELDYPTSAAIEQNPPIVELDPQQTLSTVAYFNEAIDREHCYDSPMFGDCGERSRPNKLKKYFFHALTGQCERYPFSECGAISRNSFDSKVLCDKICTTRLRLKVASVCSRRTQECSKSRYIYWRYDPQRSICELYPSCMNRSTESFIDEETCTRTCVPPLAKKKDLFDVCHLPPTNVTNCSIPSLMWFFDYKSQTCLSSRGCKSYGNNFLSKTSCQQWCLPHNPQDVCKLPVDVGPCNSTNITQYFFDWKVQKCTTFAYGGCLGNRNRFPSLADCSVTCPTVNKCNIRTRKTRCAVPIEERPPIYGYVAEENKCRRINETVCGNNIKFHQTPEKCEEACLVSEEVRTATFNIHKKRLETIHWRCRENLRFNNHPICAASNGWLPRFFYNEEKEECAFYYYNGCDGLEDRGNRFSTLSLCQMTCSISRATIPSTATSASTTSHSKTTEITTKSDLCPEPHNPCSRLLLHRKVCHSDADCDFDGKCCLCESSNSLTTQCLKPIGCRLSKYGCCSNSDMVATDLLHTNCPKTPARSVYVSETKMIVESQLNFYLQCLFSGDPRPNITWMHMPTKRKVEVEPVTDLLEPLWSGALQFDNSESVIEGLWVCHGANEIGQDDIEVMVTSSPTASIPLLQLHGDSKSTIKYVAFSSSACIHCPMYGIPRPWIKWFFNNSLVRDGDHIEIRHRFLCLNDILFLHEGLWSCVGERVSRSISYTTDLRVVEPLRILPSPGGTIIKANIGQKVFLYCNVQGKSLPNITWSIVNDGTEAVLRSSTTNDSRVFVIPNYHFKRQVDIRCRVNNKVSEDSVNFELIPTDHKDILADPAGFHFMGDQVTLHCPDKPKEKIYHVVWKKDNILLKTNGLKLLFLLNSQSDSGFYTCQHGGRSYQTYLHVHSRLT